MEVLVAIAAIALSQPVELHVAPGCIESRLLLRAIERDVPVICEDTWAIAYYQLELRRCVIVKHGVDCYVKVGRHATRLPMTAFDSVGYTVLAIKRELDMHHAARRAFERPDHDAEYVKRAGIINLGSEGTEVAFPQPWEAEHQLTAWHE